MPASALNQIGPALHTPADSTSANTALTDLFVLGAAKRALSLSASIFMLVDEEQMLAAITLARPHLDTLLRLHSLELVGDVAEHVTAIMGGERLDKRKDRRGRPHHQAPTKCQNQCGSDPILIGGISGTM